MEVHITWKIIYWHYFSLEQRKQLAQLHCLASLEQCCLSLIFSLRISVNDFYVHENNFFSKPQTLSERSWLSSRAPVGKTSPS